MKQVVIIALALVALYMASCKKNAASGTPITLPAQNPSAQLSLLQNSWKSSEAVAIPYYGDSSYGWFGNYIFPYSINFSKNGTATMYISIDLSDDQYYDSCAYRLLADDKTLLCYAFTRGVLSAKADTATISMLNDSTLVLGFPGTKTPCVPDAFHR
jgi:hypothetical protein